MLKPNKPVDYWMKNFAAEVIFELFDF